MAEKKTEKAEKEATTLQQDITAIVRSEVNRSAQEIANHLQGQINSIAQQLDSKATGLNRLAPAYIQARKACRMAVKNATNPHLRNTYADLGSVLEAVTEAFLENDLWLVQSPGEITIKEGKPYQALIGALLHGSGQSLQFRMELPAYTVSKTGEMVLNPQTSGSAIAYARRYMWNAVAGLTQVDDDADAASYIDQVDPPGKATASTASAPQEKAAGPDKAKADAMIERIKAAADMDALKKLRDEANGLKVKAVSDAYMARREALLPSS